MSTNSGIYTTHPEVHRLRWEGSFPTWNGPKHHYGCEACGTHFVGKDGRHGTCLVIRAFAVSEIQSHTYLCDDCALDLARQLTGQTLERYFTSRDGSVTMTDETKDQTGDVEDQTGDTEDQYYHPTQARGIFSQEPHTREQWEARLGKPLFEDDEYAVYYAEHRINPVVVFQKNGLGWGIPCIEGRGSYHEGIERMMRGLKEQQDALQEQQDALDARSKP